MDRMPQKDINYSLDFPPSNTEIIQAINQLSSGNVRGSGVILADIYKDGGAVFVGKLTQLFQSFWNQQTNPQEQKDASITQIFKRKGNQHVCDNHGGISLLSIADLMVPKSSEWENKTIITEFILLGLSNDPKTQNFLFFVFMIIFLVTVLGNIVIILVIKSEFHFQTPMFFFLSHLAFVDICYSSVTVPKMLANFITKQKTISWEGCIAQIFFFLQTSSTELLILSAMGYDRYVAICDPLHYNRYLTKEKCNKMMGGAWFLGFLGAIWNVLPLLNLHFCSNNIIKHYNCELPSLLPLSCTETLPNYIALLIIILAYGFSSFLFTLVSYINIISSILKIKSSGGRQKAFSTCSSHLIVVGLFYITAFICYMKPSSESFMDLDKVISIQYSILTPMLNPIIYSLKNKQILCGLEKLFGKCRAIILT
ncbi:olfactory receptor 5AR1-like [Erythrolamprus reginae]|uniref:olfactory receptor 5AR1-like n=1 Tax=Erythrolamprus reginae TaxID=121349 RepID=UPI00396C6A5E